MNPGRGIALKIASTFVFTLMLVCVKATASRIPPGEIVFCRSLFAILPIFAMLAWQGEFFRAVSTQRPWLHVRRGAIGIVSMACGFAALGFLPLPESMMISYAAPLMVVALSALILGETVRVYRWTATAVGFLGIAIILWPRLSMFGANEVDRYALAGIAFALAAAFCSAFAAIFVRSMTRTETVGSIVLYFALSGAVFSLASLPFGWVVPTVADAALLVAVGLFGGIGQILMTTAYRYAGAATIASFEYVSMIWGLMFGYLFFDEIPTTGIVIGGAVVVASGIFIIYRERRLGMERQRTAMPTK